MSPIGVRLSRFPAVPQFLSWWRGPPGPGAGAGASDGPGAKA
ncbi:hypothetical protein HanRHA438_Chr05g0224781 [Helianthus annuus]|nr:hypothetical protein HanRHA438_Chr05g0224781 [Helianthus annuus]